MNKVSRLAVRRLAGAVIAGALLGAAGPIGCAGSVVVGLGTTLVSSADALGTLVKRAVSEGRGKHRRPVPQDDPRAETRPEAPSLDGAESDQKF